MPRVSRPLPSDLRRRAFTLAEADAAGLTDHELRRHALRIPTPGVRTAGAAPAASDVRARCAEISPALPGDAVFCHVTALELLGADLPFGVPEAGPLHVQVGPQSSWPRRAGLIAHQRSAPTVPFVRLAGGVRVLAPATAWTQLACDVAPGELVVAADALMRRRSPLCTPDQLRETVERLPAGTRGVRRLRAAVEQARARTDSCMETRLRTLLVDGGLPCPVVNVPVRSAEGLFVALPDLSYPRERVAIEYDGDVHRTDRRTWRRDIARRQSMESEGWRVITTTADDVLRHPTRPLAWVRHALAR